MTRRSHAVDTLWVCHFISRARKGGTNDEGQGSDGWAIPSALALALALSDPFPMLPPRVPPATDRIIARIICSQTGDLRDLRVPL